MQRVILISVIATSLSGCNWFAHQANSLGQHMPVLSEERCEHWQCFTESGQEQSRIKQQSRYPSQTPMSSEEAHRQQHAQPQQSDSYPADPYYQQQTQQDPYQQQSDYYYQPQSQSVATTPQQRNNYLYTNQP